MTGKNVYAYTQLSPTSYPGFISVNVPHNSELVFITVRTPGSFGTQVASVPVPDDRLEEFARALLAHLDEKLKRRLA